MALLNVAGKLRGDACLLGVTGPLGDGGLYFLDDLPRLLEKAGRRAQQILQGKVIPFAIEGELVGIDPGRARLVAESNIKGWRQLPALLSMEDEAKVLGMVVLIARQVC